MLFTPASVLYRRSRLWVAIAITGLLLNACSNGLGQSLQQSLSADPQLEENADQLGAEALSRVDACPQDVVDQLPDSFPGALCYPNGELVEARSPDASTNAATNANADANAATSAEDAAQDATEAVQTTWTTSDPKTQVLQFYRSQLEDNNWEITNPSEVDQAIESGSNESGSNAGEAPASTDEEQARDSNEGSQRETRIEAVKAGDRATITLAAAKATAEASPDQAENQSENQATAAGSEAESEVTTEFTVEWQPSDSTQAQFDENGTSADDIDATNPSSGTSNAASQGPSQGFNQSSSSRPRSSGSSTFSDLDEAPDDLEPYLRDLAPLSVLTPMANPEGASNASRAEFAPNATVNRRTYARWLFEVNNELYGDRPARKIRAATATAQPVFSDVPQSDPDFEVIQGLAEAGLIPSPLSGASTQVSFQPDAALTREALLTWKVPLDIRGTLPVATVDAVEETWGFQDANRINPNALKAVLADYQNGDNANVLRAFGYTTLFQPQKAVTRAEAAATLWYFGYQGEGISAGDTLTPNDN